MDFWICGIDGMSLLFKLNYETTKAFPLKIVQVGKST